MVYKFAKKNFWNTVYKIPIVLHRNLKRLWLKNAVSFALKVPGYIIFFPYRRSSENISFYFRIDPEGILHKTLKKICFFKFKINLFEFSKTFFIFLWNKIFAGILRKKMVLFRGSTTWEKNNESWNIERTADSGWGLIYEVQWNPFIRTLGRHIKSVRKSRYVRKFEVFGKRVFRYI